jgi:hypothetical protein
MAVFAAVYGARSEKGGFSGTLCTERGRGASTKGPAPSPPSVLAGRGEGAGTRPRSGGHGAERSAAHRPGAARLPQSGPATPPPGGTPVHLRRTGVFADPALTTGPYALLSDCDTVGQSRVVELGVTCKLAMLRSLRRRRRSLRNGGRVAFQEEWPSMSRVSGRPS